jgi:hypothetical protein
LICSTQPVDAASRVGRHEQVHVAGHRRPFDDRGVPFGAPLADDLPLDQESVGGAPDGGGCGGDRPLHLPAAPWRAGRAGAAPGVAPLPVPLERGRAPAEIREQTHVPHAVQAAHRGPGQVGVAARRIPGGPAAGVADLRRRAPPLLHGHRAREAGVQGAEEDAALAGVHHPRVLHPRSEAAAARRRECARGVVAHPAERADVGAGLPRQSRALVRLVRGPPPRRTRTRRGRRDRHRLGCRHHRHHHHHHHRHRPHRIHRTSATTCASRRCPRSSRGSTRR